MVDLPEFGQFIRGETSLPQDGTQCPGGQIMILVDRDDQQTSSVR